MINLMATCLNNLTRLSLRALVKTSLAAMAALVLSAYTHANVDRVTYLHYDGLGSAIAGTDEQGAIKWRENYQPYGQRTEYETDNHTVWFTGKPEEADFELQYYGGRWYDPNLGRFNSIDPQGFVESSPMSFNRYAYANNNPYSYVDPDGELPFLVPLAIFLVKEAAAEVASHYTNGWSDFLSVRRMVTGGARYLSRTLRRGGGDVTKSAGQLGREGEAAASSITGVGKNTQKFSVNGRTRIPDQVNASSVSTKNPLHVTEVKNVKYQSYTRQLRDNVDLVGGVGGGGRIDIFVRSNTKVSGPLQKAHDNPLNPINIRREL